MAEYKEISGIVQQKVIDKSNEEFNTYIPRNGQLVIVTETVNDDTTASIYVGDGVNAVKDCKTISGGGDSSYRRVQVTATEESLDSDTWSEISLDNYTDLGFLDAVINGYQGIDYGSSSVVTFDLSQQKSTFIINEAYDADFETTTIKFLFCEKDENKNVLKVYTIDTPYDEAKVSVNGIFYLHN